MRFENKESLKIPPLSTFKAQLEGSGDRAVSTTMSFVRLLSTLSRNKEIGERVVPIVPDEARTFGMEGMFRQLEFIPLLASFMSLKIQMKLVRITNQKMAKF
ncbi:MAG: hypothetical protein Ct9H90mP27_7100 [Gammaproteobacteria bacterium]|nr:MAG: hypothetical protein Ct9H90mP27_7100 [Gammaproteobacteria bacterium]